MSKSNYLNHPHGLYILFFVELWERFSYYGMRALLVLYMTAKSVEELANNIDHSQAGLGWTQSKALSLYGGVTLL